MSSPTQRSLALLKKRGYRAAVVEKWNPHARIRQDLFGIIDILAIREGETLAVQACAGSGGAAAARQRKIEDSDAIIDIRAAGWGVHVHAWRKRQLKGKRPEWVCREVDLS